MAVVIYGNVFDHERRQTETVNQIGVVPPGLLIRTSTTVVVIM